MDTQTLWRHKTTIPNGCGFLLWEVIEIIGEPYRARDNFIETLDGSSVYLYCTHFFDAEQAEYYLHREIVDGEQQLVVIP